MAGKFARSWALLNASADVLRSDKSLLMFPLFSGICTLLVAATFLTPVAVEILADERIRSYGVAHHVSPLHYVFLFLFYLAQYTVIIFFNTALAAVATARLRGDEATVKDGLAVARSRFGAILGYAVIAATVGMLLRALQERLGFIGRIVVGMIGLAWTVATFLVVPVLANEEVGPLDAVQRSVDMLKRTWGENLIGNAGIGLAFGVITFVAILVSVVLVVLAVASQSLPLIVAMVAIVLIGLALLGMIQSSLQGVYAVALYRYVDEGEAGAGFDQAALEQAFRSK
ncbi:DUF6159 family protein [Dyella caseinilytica]|uniref:Glycerophosphoryl diester phosphodiesterase membrane domain-containing protein n=1 Tax=Dyella caseinilytica TaxID=1849581 RepID=A0ABX7GW35_9GAMM|nr:DUF6159 family protein [Dyella caseinilytica]QRN54084.1 hypothetical protein ISN74_01375 [Dyella caseinilytica]GFZ91475.1 hypothetical protein GCM10011408_08460 [Dyella caseinilytica]